jgi:predicted transcriptional regulator
MVPTSLRFSRVLRERIDKLAAAKRVTRTATIEKLLARALDELASTTGDVPTQEQLKERRRRRR